MSSLAARVGGVAARDPEIRSEHFIWVLGSLCRVFRLPFEAALLLQQFPPPHSLVSFQQAASALGLRSGVWRTRRGKLDRLSLPALAFLRQDSGAATAQPALIVRHDGERIIYLEAGADEPRVRPVREFQTAFEPVVLLVAPNAESETSVLAQDAPRRFGFRWFLPELSKHRSVWRDVLLASLAIQLVGLATPLFTQVIIDKVIVHHTRSTLLALSIGLGVFLVFNAVMSWMRQYLLIHTGNRVDAVLASSVFAHLFRLPAPYFEHRPTGTTVARLQGVETIRDFITGAAVALVLDLPFLLVILAVMLVYSWQLTLIAIGILLLLSLLSLIITPVLRERLNQQFLLGARNQAFVTEYVSGVEAVKSLQFEPQLERRYGEYLSTYLAATFATRQLANTYHVIAGALEQLMTLAILVAGALLVMRADGFTIGMLVAFQMFAVRMAQPMLRIAGLWQEFQQASIAVKRLGDIMDAPAEPYSIVPTTAASTAGHIEIQNLSFQYSDRHPYLYRGLSLSIQPRTLAVVTGPSGSGKSTLAKLLLAFYQPTDGRILLDGRDLRHLAANELRQAFGVVPQETRLFSGTVFDNLAMANPRAGFEDIVAACKAAEIHDVIERLPHGYQTLLGEHGVGLSGGQKQRLAIARALLKRPRILIFDEATSNLDNETAEALARTINRLKAQATTVFVAHNVPAVLEVDHQLRLWNPVSKT